MELNLDRLNGLAYSDFQQTHAENQPARTPPEKTLGDGGYKSSQEQLKATEEHIEGLGALQRKADQNKIERDRALEAYRAYQENMRKSGQLQTDILKGIKEGEDIYSLFLKAVQAISCMTSNTMLYTQAEEDLKSIYGAGLLEKPPLQLQLEQTQTRLQRLIEAQERERDSDSKQRIGAAIKAHRSKISELEETIAHSH